MIRRDDVTRSFYEDRRLPVPQAEHVPEDAGELRELVVGAGADDPPRLLIGDGQHLRDAIIGERSFEVIRTERCKRVLSVDRESRIVRVEAGIRWHGLRDELAERGLSLQRFRLYPATATIGGLLARRHGDHRAIFDGDVRTACCALSAVSPRRADYRYISAPRKASGPDLRYLFIGGEGLLGAILDATLVAWAPTSGRLYRWELEQAGDAVDIVAKLYDIGAHVSWSHYRGARSGEGVLQVAVHGPERLLARLDKVLRDHRPPTEVGDAEAVAEVRHRLEVSHPDRRSLKRSRRTLEAIFSLHDLPVALAALTSSAESVESIEVWDFTRHRARVFVRHAAGKEGVARVELPAQTAARALGVRPVVDDEAVHWPHWTQTLKTALDPERKLATGP